MIRLATKADLPRLEQIYAAARDFMRRSGNPHQWVDGYPTQALLAEDIVQNRLYAIEEVGRVCGCFMFCPGPDPTYHRIYDGAWAADTPYGVIHRIAGDGTVKGILRQCVAFAQQQYPHLRIDTHRQNLPMQRALAAAGFIRRGIIYLANGDERIAYDRITE